MYLNKKPEVKETSVVRLVKPHELFNLLQDTSQTKLITDFRDKDKEYQVSHVRAAIHLPRVYPIEIIEEEDDEGGVDEGKKREKDVSKHVDKHFPHPQFKLRGILYKKLVFIGDYQYCVQVANLVLLEQRKSKKIEHIFICCNEVLSKFEQKYPFMITNQNQVAHPKVYPSEIWEDFLFLGAKPNAESMDQLKHLGITHILNMAEEIENAFEHQQSIKYLKLGIGDTEADSLADLFDKAVYFFEECMKHPNAKILVHCNMGISRSTSMVIIYLMRFKDMSYDEAFDFVKGQRSFVQPNQTFQKELRSYYEKHLAIKNQ